MRWLVVTVAVALLPSLIGSDLTGTWIGTLPKRGRTPAKDVALQLVQRDQDLTGKVYNDAGTSDSILSGSVRGERVRFEVDALEQAGNQINIVRYRYEGTVCEGAIEVTREMAAARDASSGNSIPVRRRWDSDEQDRERRFRHFRLDPLVRSTPSRRREPD